MTALAHDQILPDATDVSSALAALPHIERYLGEHEQDASLRLAVDGDEPLSVPRGVVELLARILTHVAAGQGVTVVPLHAELTTQQAADMLNVSRPYLIGLLDAGEIEYRKVGTHRRIVAASLLAYKDQDDHKRARIADELSALDQEMGLH